MQPRTSSSASIRLTPVCDTMSSTILYSCARHEARTSLPQLWSSPAVEASSMARGRAIFGRGDSAGADAYGEAMLPQPCQLRGIEELSGELGEDMGGEHERLQHIKPEQVQSVQGARDRSVRRPKKAELTSCRHFAAMPMSAATRVARLLSRGSSDESSAIIAR